MCDSSTEGGPYTTTPAIASQLSQTLSRVATIDMMRDSLPPNAIGAASALSDAAQTMRSAAHYLLTAQMELLTVELHAGGE